MTPDTTVAVIGAGISGLVTAHFLAEKGLNPHLVETRERAGGTIRTTRINGFLVEHGPNSAQDTTPLLRRLCADLGIEETLEYPGAKARNRYVVRAGTLHPLPLSPPAMIRSRLFSTRAKLRLLAEPFIPPAPSAAEETLAEFTQRRLGREFLDYAIDPFVAGVYAGRPEDLSVRSGFPRLYRLEQRYGSLTKGAILGVRERRKRREESGRTAPLFSFRDGMQTLVDALVQQRPEALHTNTTVKAIRKLEQGFELDLEQADKNWRLQARALVLTIPAHACQNLDFQFEIELKEALRPIHYPPVSLVFFGYREAAGGRPLDGFGFLVPRLERRQILGTIWNSTLFSNRAPQGGVALSTFVGGSRQPENAGWSDARLVDAVYQDLRDLLGIHERPDEVLIQRWPRAIPQYRLGHQQFVDTLSTLEERHPGLYISGNFRNGISVGDCLEQAHALSARIAAESADRETNVNNMRGSKPSKKPS